MMCLVNQYTICSRNSSTTGLQNETVSAFKETLLVPRRKSFGVPQLSAREPEKFLRRHEKLRPVRLPEPREAKIYRQQQARHLSGVSAKVQCRDGQTRPTAVSNQKVQQRFPVNWREKNKSRAATYPNPAYLNRLPYRVNRSNGDRRRMESSDLAPHYRLRRGYGSLPHYIQRYREMHKDQQQTSIAKQKAFELELNSKSRHVANDEQSEVIKGLEARLKHTMQLFQGLSVVLDNQTKLRDRQHLEREINDLEKLIESLKSHKIVIVSHDDPACCNRNSL
ncbi:uncharacterized protein LOC129586789 isoform X2 [Paramacrobiotus metropolitanus]|uniref:uncharacterized protein LOC129586789 isoform X2 n=1 Tax=Paramacrobiotus metropolitanus TaxID=2943436 RepID=UPI002446490F|nr:uncharacterized protein LOC129586789 isoform X2 [Paramacrobiotus metropolitanus]